MTTPDTKSGITAVLSSALLERIDDLAQWFTDNPNRDDIKDGLCVLVRDVAFAEHERIAQHFDSRDKGAGGFYDPHEPAEIIRAMSSNAGNDPRSRVD